MSRCLRKLTEGGAVDAESFGFPKLSSQSPPSHFQQYNQGHFHNLAFLCEYSGGCVVDAHCSLQDVDVWDKVEACGGIEEVVRKT